MTQGLRSRQELRYKTTEQSITDTMTLDLEWLDVQYRLLG